MTSSMMLVLAKPHFSRNAGKVKQILFRVTISCYYEAKNYYLCLDAPLFRHGIKSGV
jgi:hypothetical protein